MSRSIEEYFSPINSPVQPRWLSKLTVSDFNSCLFDEMVLLIYSFVASLVLALLCASRLAKKDTQFWKAQSVVGIRESQSSWLWARLKSVGYTCTWTSEGYSKVSLLNIEFIFSSLTLALVLQGEQALHHTYSGLRTDCGATTPANQTCLQLDRNDLRCPSSPRPDHAIALGVSRPKYSRRTSPIQCHPQSTHAGYPRGHATCSRRNRVRFLTQLGTGDRMEGDSGVELGIADRRRRCKWRVLRSAALYRCLYTTLGGTSGHLLTLFLVTVGQDIVFLDKMKDHALTIFAGALVLNCFPASLYPVLGPLLSWVSGFMGNRAMKRSLPVVEARLKQTPRWKAESDDSWKLPVRVISPYPPFPSLSALVDMLMYYYLQNDALQWIIDECYSSKDPTAQLHPKRVCQRLLFVNDVSILTTAYTAQNFILDLFSTDPSRGYAGILRRECEEAPGITGKMDAGGRKEAPASRFGDP